MTNLSDKLRTRVVIDKSTGMDIRRLNLDSIHVDKHKSRHASVKRLVSDTLRPKQVLMVRPLYAKDEYGKIIKINDAYVNLYASRKLSPKSLAIARDDGRDLLVQDLNPAMIYLNGARIQE